jgi:Domain of unknown function (DUF4440)
MAHALDDLAGRSDDFDRVVLSRDRELAAEVLADDYALVLLHPAPAVVPRSAWIEMLPDYVVDDWEMQERKIEVRDDLGLVFQRVNMDATVLGEDRSGLFILSDVWVPVDDVWRIWRRQSTPLSAGRMPGSTS